MPNLMTVAHVGAVGDSYAFCSGCYKKVSDFDPALGDAMLQPLKIKFGNSYAFGSGCPKTRGTPNLDTRSAWMPNLNKFTQFG